MSSNVIFDVRNFTKTVWTPTILYCLPRIHGSSEVLPKLM